MLAPGIFNNTELVVNFRKIQKYEIIIKNTIYDNCIKVLNAVKFKIGKSRVCILF